MSFSKITKKITGEIIGKSVSAEISADVSELTPGHFIITTDSGVREIFLTPTSALSDGNIFGEINCTIETERERIMRERFGEAYTNDHSPDAKKGMVLKAPMPGMVKLISVSVGDKVDKQTQVLVLEAMKMDNSITAGFSGKVSKIHITAGTSVEKNMPMMEFEQGLAAS